MQTTDLLHLIYVFVPAPRVLDTRLEAAGREAEAFVKFVAETSKGSVDPPPLFHFSSGGQGMSFDIAHFFLHKSSFTVEIVNSASLLGHSGMQ